MIEKKKLQPLSEIFLAFMLITGMLAIMFVRLLVPPEPWSSLFLSYALLTLVPGMYLLMFVMMLPGVERAVPYLVGAGISTLGNVVMLIGLTRGKGEAGTLGIMIFGTLLMLLGSVIAAIFVENRKLFIP